MTLLVVVSNLGKGVGPLVAAALIGELGRFPAFNIAVGFFIVSCVPYFVAICQLGKDIRRQVRVLLALAPCRLHVALLLVVFPATHSLVLSISEGDGGGSDYQGRR